LVLKGGPLGRAGKREKRTDKRFSLPAKIPKSTFCSLFARPHEVTTLQHSLVSDFVECTLGRLLILSLVLQYYLFAYKYSGLLDLRGITSYLTQMFWQDNSTFASPTYIYIAAILGFATGFLVNTTSNCYSLGVNLEAEVPEHVNHLKTEDLLQQSFGIEDVFKHSEEAFSCNSRLAFEELTRLHMRSLQLQSRRRQGEANRARTASIIEKAGQATAAEKSFRKCVSDMMPELLADWDKKLEMNQLKQPWNEDKIPNSITFEELEKTATLLDA